MDLRMKNGWGNRGTSRKIRLGNILWVYAEWGLVGVLIGNLRIIYDELLLKIIKNYYFLEGKGQILREIIP
jgi:hypothetical protein